MELKDRLKQARKRAGKSQKDIAEKVGITQPTLSQLESGTINSTSFLPAIADFLGVDAYWLQTGKEPAHTNQQFIQVEDWDSDTPLDNSEVEIPFFKDFNFACGSGSVGEATESETRKLRMSRSTLRSRNIDPKNSVATLACGNSMSPTIKDGDTIHVDIGRKAIKDGKMFAIFHGGHFYAKRLYNAPLGAVRIVSDNSEEYPELILNKEEQSEQQFEIIGWIWQVSSIESW